MRLVDVRNKNPHIFLAEMRHYLVYVKVCTIQCNTTDLLNSALFYLACSLYRIGWQSRACIKLWFPIKWSQHWRYYPKNSLISGLQKRSFHQHHLSFNLFELGVERLNDKVLLGHLWGFRYCNPDHTFLLMHRGYKIKLLLITRKPREILNKPLKFHSLFLVHWMNTS